MRNVAWRKLYLYLKREKSFNDIEGFYGKDQIKELKALGIVNGDGKGNFCPEEFIKRGDIAIIISNLLKYLRK